MWHAKRMKMITMWGFKIPLTPNLKCTKALFRANSDYCAIYDTSYFASIHLIGDINDIKEILNKHIDPLDGIQQEIHGSKMIFSEFPNDKIGPILFILKQDKCWLSVHPSIFTEIMEILDKYKDSFKVVVAQDYARFELTGPKSLEILKASLDLENQKVKICIMIIGLGKYGVSSVKWYFINDYI